VFLVPAYNACSTPNGTHGEPLDSPSCSPPVQSSLYLTIGIPPSEPANSTGLIILRTLGESPINSQNGDQADVEITTRITDVRNKTTLTDYTGEVRVASTLRITDRNNGPGLIHPATTIDVPFGFSVSCAATPADTTTGSTCMATTTADAVMPGLVREGMRAVWGLGEVQVYDGGADGDGDTGADNSLFETQGLFAP
jgi:hypothetical protein